MIRKIDELGRIVIPKEIRNTLNIKDNDKLEITVDQGKVVLSKVEELDDLIKQRDYLNELIENYKKE